MSKIIIDNRSHLLDDVALQYVHSHMLQNSMVYDKNYLAAATYCAQNSEILIFHEKNRKSDRFIVEDA